MTDRDDHDSVTTLLEVTRQMAGDVKGMRAELTTIGSKLSANEMAIARLQSETSGRSALIAEHNDMYGFYSTFKQFLWPLFLSGPVSAISAAVATYLLVK